MKHIIEFNLPEEQEELELAANAGALYSALFDVRNQIFRPARKHGYQEDDLQNLSDKEVDLIHKLELMFNEVLNHNGLGEFDI